MTGAVALAATTPVAMLAVHAPTQAVEGRSPSPQVNSLDASVQVDSVAVASDTGLVSELSTRTSTTVRNSDGTLTAEISQGPVNYLSDGVWLPIDNTFVEASGATYSVTNSSNAYEAFLPENPSTEPVKFSVDGSWVKMRMQGLGAQRPQIDSTDSTEATLTVSRGADEVAYQATDSGLKETIVLDTPPPSRVSFTYELEVSPGLTPRLGSDGTITFANEAGDSPFSIPAGNMADSAGPEPAYSGEVHYDLTSDNVRDRYRLRVTPSAAWLADPARIYPVRIDPSLDTYPPKDYWMQEDTPNTSRCIGAFIWAGRVNNYRRRGLLDFRINAVPAEATIQSSNVFLWLDGSNSVGSGGAANYGLWQPGRDWSQAATWNNSGTGAGWGAGDIQTRRSNLISLNGGGGWVNWDVSQFVNYWRTGSLPNRGMVLAQDGESVKRGLAFVGQAQNNGFKPILRITYTNNLPPDAPPRTVLRPETDDGYTNTTPRIRTVVSDPEGAQVQAQTYIFRSDGSTLWGTSGPMVPSGGTSSVDVPAGLLSVGSRYYTASAAYDGNSAGSFSPAHWFTVDPEMVAASDDQTNDQVVSEFYGGETVDDGLQYVGGSRAGARTTSAAAVCSDQSDVSCARSMMTACDDGTGVTDVDEGINSSCPIEPSVSQSGGTCDSSTGPCPGDPGCTADACPMDPNCVYIGEQTWDEGTEFACGYDSTYSTPQSGSRSAAVTTNSFPGDSDRLSVTGGAHCWPSASNFQTFAYYARRNEVCYFQINRFDLYAITNGVPKFRGYYKVGTWVQGTGTNTSDAVTFKYQLQLLELKVDDPFYPTTQSLYVDSSTGAGFYPQDISPQDSTSSIMSEVVQNPSLRTTDDLVRNVRVPQVTITPVATSVDASKKTDPGPYFRCDSKTYLKQFANRTGCVVLGYTPTFTLSLTNPKHKESALHIREAKRRFGWGNSSKPLIRGNLTLTDANRKAACDDFTGPLSCDEYPFASSLQGCSIYPNQCSVKSIPVNDNKSSGAKLGAFYKKTRLFRDIDQFYVRIVP